LNKDFYESIILFYGSNPYRKHLEKLGLKIIVHSASEPEPFGRVIVEGMAAGCPVIATRAGGVLDIIEDNLNGLLVPPKDEQAMARAMVHLLRNRVYARELEARAREDVIKRFSAEQHVKAFSRLCHEVLDNSNRTSG
jgi:glycosyltransferase involved in cell wall biosynthesis